MYANSISNRQEHDDKKCEFYPLFFFVGAFGLGALRFLRFLVRALELQLFQRLFHLC